ncbi:MAG: hypothetical protein IT376_13860 [Polyangiaceae bacterium]|nr:hypothetical protein [Polyangiaceae bacterium]
MRLSGVALRLGLLGAGGMFAGCAEEWTDPSLTQDAAGESAVECRRGWTRIDGPLGAYVLLPPGEDPTGIAIELAAPAPARPFVAAGAPFRFLPAGRQFRRPALLVLPLHAGLDSRPPMRGPHLVYSQASVSAAWEAHRALRLPHTSSVALAVRHFSVYQPSAGPQNSDGPDATGTWNGTLDFYGSIRPYTVQLHRREDGDVLGYVPGGTARRFIQHGAVAGDQLNFELHHEDPKAARVFHVTATIEPAGGAEGAGRLVGEAINTWTQGTDGSGMVPDPVPVQIDWSRTLEDLEERRFVFAPEPVGEQLYQVAIVTKPDGSFVSGGYVSQSTSCYPWGCGGGITSFVDTGTAVVMGLATAGGCSAGSAVTATFDTPTLLYAGSSMFYAPASNGTCNPTPTNAPVIGAKSTRTRTQHAAQALAALGRIADDLEAGASTAFASPHAGVSSGYVHDGVDEGQFLAALAAEATAGAEEVELDRFQGLVTVVEPQMYPVLGECNDASCFGVDFHDRRTRRESDGSLHTYRDHESFAVGELRYLAEGADGVWRVAGNGIDHYFDLPFAYDTASVTPADTLLPILTDGGAVYASLSSWGSHFGPQTGHMFGDPKWSLIGYFARTESELVACNQGACGGACTPADDACGVSRADILARRPVFIAPQAGTLEGLTVEHADYSAECVSHGQCYFDDEPSWHIRTRTGQMGMEYAHVGKVHSALITQVNSARVAAGMSAVDFTRPADYVGINVVEQVNVALALGDRLGFSQVMARIAVQGPSDASTFYVGPNSASRAPWAQMEAFSRWGDRGFCWYARLPAAVQEALQRVLTNDMRASASPRYSTASASPWQFLAEAKLCNQMASTLVTDYTSLEAFLGGWFERGDAGAADEIVAFAPIQKATDAWVADVADLGYHSPETTTHLVGRQRQGDSPYTWIMPDSTTREVRHPVAEMVLRSPVDFVLRYRPSETTYPNDTFQRVLYQLDWRGLRLRYGPLRSTLAEAVGESLAFAGVCDQHAELCYDHQKLSGF